MSEGIDFADRDARAVVITGIPFPAIKDPKVVLKKKFMDANRSQQLQQQAKGTNVRSRYYILSTPLNNMD